MSPERIENRRSTGPHLRPSTADWLWMTARLSGPAQRRVSFEYPDDLTPIWTPRLPEFSCAANSVSLMMPTIEPYFVRSARFALDDLGQDDEVLAAEVQGYVFQEAQHHGQHVRFNRTLQNRYGHLAGLERAIGSAYGIVERRGSQAFNSAFAAASETMAYSAARWAADHRTELFTGADDVASTLFLWHLAEEVEHKSVAFDVYWTCYGDLQRSRLRYLSAMILALALMVAFVISGTTVMLVGERRLLHPLAWIRLIRWGVLFAFELLTNLTLSLLPGHHPDKFVDPLWYEIWLAEFDADSGTLPIWHRRAAGDPLVP